MWDIKIQIIFFQPNWTEETFVTKKVKDATPWVYVIGIYGYINGEETTGTFYEQELQKNITRVQNWKVIKKKVINCMSNGKDMIILLIVG